MPHKILVIGKNGQLGQEFQHLANNPTIFLDAEFIFTGHSELDITNQHTLANFFELHKPDFCINCAAYTAVDKAENERDLAYQINAIGVQHIAKECKKYDTILIHYSTDYVFDGQNYKPYIETDTTSPVNYYGQTKLDGELLALQENPKTLIIRTSWVYSQFGNNFVKTISRLARERDTLSIVADQIGTPTSAKALAENTLQIIENLERTPDESKYGIYHYSNLGVASWYDFARQIAQLQYITCDIQPISSSQYPTPAMRPYYSILDKQKIVSTFNLQIPHWEVSLKKIIDEVINC